MSGASTNLSNYHAITSPQSVTLANGSRAKVTGFGTMDLTLDIHLLSVFHVSGFPFNLSISKITKSL
jgi:hypothetical protein